MMVSGPSPDPRLHPNARKLTVLVTTDEHGSLKGASKLQSYIDKTMAENPGTTAVVSCGDVFAGDAVSQLDDNATALKLMTPYHIVELGNWDFNKGKEFLEKWANQSNFTVLGANVKDSATGQQVSGVKTHTFLELGGFKVGFVGVVTPTTAESARPEAVAGIDFKDPVKAGQDAVAACQAEGADAILALTHLTESEDDVFTSNVGGILFNMGGHTHEVTPQADGALHPLAKVGSMRSHIGKLEILMDEDTRKPLQWSYQQIPVSSLPEPESSPTKTMVDATLNRIESAMSQPVAYLKHDLPNTYDDASPLLNFAGQQVLKSTGADVVAFDRGQIRGPGILLKGKEEVSAQQIINSAPWHSKLWTVEVPKERLQEIVDASRARAMNDSLRLGLSGLDTSGPELKLSNGAPLPDMVKLVTTSYIAQGKSGYFHAGEIKGPQQEWPTIRNFVEDGLRSQDARSTALPTLTQALAASSLALPKPI
jgi:2',3'-cyclic-nucleotide 2'-phosphodiesterase (5'-nucleotidase family)